MCKVRDTWTALTDLWIFLIHNEDVPAIGVTRAKRKQQRYVTPGKEGVGTSKPNRWFTLHS
jgi:hypothetical protein